MQHSALSPRIRTLLAQRTVVTDEAIEAFLNPQFERDTHNPAALADIERATTRVLAALASGERIAVYSDFDCDGIPGAVILHDFFRLIGATQLLEVYIPHRDEEGYGFHVAAIDKLKKKGVTLIITVDVGASAHESVTYAQAQGVDVIVTDHHAYEDLPPAHAVVHPARAPYPFPHLCGAGVAFKFVQALLAAGKKEEVAAFVAVPAGAEKWMLDMVGIATVSDMVPLIGENRCLASFGLLVLRKSRRPGVRALCKVARVNQAYFNEEDIGFAFGPRINAASRMGNPLLAFSLFTTTSEEEAETIARSLDALNTKRKTSTGLITKAVKKRIEDMTTIPEVIVLGSSEWRPALLGSVATNIVATYGRPVCLWGRESTGVLKGSARTDGTVSVIALLQGAGAVLLHSGGHVGAGGFAIDETKLLLLEPAVVASYRVHRVTKKASLFEHETVALHEVHESMVRELSALRPYGEGNPKPLWSITGRIQSIGVFGKEKNHLEVKIQNEAGQSLRAYAFFMTPASLGGVTRVGTLVTVVGSLERNLFSRGAVELRLVSCVAASDEMFG